VDDNTIGLVRREEGEIVVETGGLVRKEGEEVVQLVRRGA